MRIFVDHRLFWFTVVVILNNFAVGLSGIYLPNIPQNIILLILTGLVCVLAMLIALIPKKLLSKNNNVSTITSKVPFKKRKANNSILNTESFDIKHQSGVYQTEVELTAPAFFSNYLSMLIVDSNFKINRINAAFSLLSGYSKSDSLDSHLSIFINTENADEFQATIKAYFKYNHQKSWEGEITCRRKQGNPFPAKLIISPIKTQIDSATYYVVNLLDLTQQRESENRIIRLAHYDDLTGLCNRVMFCDHLAKLLSRAKRHQGYTVILYLGLDRLKTVNDSLGHQIGDELIKQAASRLADSMRQEDFVARINGDEFAVMLLPESTHENAAYGATIIAQKIVTQLSEVFYIQRQEIFASVSVGIAIFPEDATNAQTLLKHGELAMYEAKKQGRGNYQFFKEEFISNTKDKNKIEVGLRKAVEKDELRLYYQPQYNARSKSIWGAEALVRWFKNQTQMVPVNHFIPIAEETGLIVPIGQWILETACQQQRYWLDSGYPIKQVSVNISARQFIESNFLQSVDDALKKAGLDPKHLELELTESMLVGDAKQIELQLKRLKKMGIKLALDDFGTGYSSLSYLKNFPIDILKIDQSFVRDLTVDSKDARIACAIIEMGHSLGQKIVAEGVENEVQLDFLTERKCDIIQGYYFSPPLPSNQMNTLLESEMESTTSA